MPTGYTADVQDGKVTEFKDFALQCARAFGALITMRDSPKDAPLPDMIEPSTSYHDSALATATARLAKLRAMTPAQIEKAAQRAWDKQLAAHNEYEAEKKLRRGRYEAMLEKVRAWTPPTHEHVGLKTFMKDQLAESIKFDCSRAAPIPEQPSSADWLSTERAAALRDIEYHTKAKAEEIERATGRTDWLQQLRKSLAA